MGRVGGSGGRVCSPGPRCRCVVRLSTGRRFELGAGSWEREIYSCHTTPGVQPCTVHGADVQPVHAEACSPHAGPPFLLELEAVPEHTKHLPGTMQPCSTLHLPRRLPRRLPACTPPAPPLCKGQCERPWRRIPTSTPRPLPASTAALAASVSAPSAVELFPVPQARNPVPAAVRTALPFAFPACTLVGSALVVGTGSNWGGVGGHWAARPDLSALSSRSPCTAQGRRGEGNSPQSDPPSWC